MEKRPVSKKQLDFIQKELSFYVDTNLIDTGQAQSINELYEIRSTFNFIKVILLLGSILVGLGVLSFIASNWQEMTKLTKFLLIIFSFTGFNLAGYRMSSFYPKVAKSLTYISAFIYGAGIFLIGQMFNFGGHFSSAFLYWSLGIIPMAILLDDIIIFVFAHLLMLVYINGSFDLNEFPYMGLVAAPLLYYLNKFFNHSKLITFFNNAVALNLFGYFLAHQDVEPTYIFIAFFIIGLLLFLLPIKFNTLVFKLQGMLLLGVFGLILTIADAWEVFKHIEYLNIYFAVGYLLLLLVLIRSGNLIALIFFCLTIFRFYVDTFYDFMPKSLFFILGGSMLLGFGYYFEKKRKVQGGLGFEK